MWRSCKVACRSGEAIECVCVRVVLHDGDGEKVDGGRGRQIHGTTFHGLPLSTRKLTTAPPILVAYLPSFSQKQRLR